MAEVVADETPGKMFDRTPRPYPLKPYIQPSVVVQTPGNCSCNQSASGFEAKIKENPLLFVIGALALGYFLAKK